MAYLGKINPHYVIDAVKCTVVRFFRSDGLLTARDTKLERLKSAILFTIAYALCVKKQDMCMLSEEKKIKNRNFIHPSSFIHPCKTFFHPGANHSPG